MSFRLAIVGRPNVGKSTLFNRLVGKRLALVDDTPGVTRDRRLAEGSIGELSFQVIDTAGLQEAGGDSLESRMREQTRQAIEQCDIVLFMIDARAGLTPADSEIAEMLYRAQNPVILVANKFEGRAAEAGYYEGYSLGLGDPVPISAEHGLGLADLHDAIVERLGEARAFADGTAEGDDATDSGKTAGPLRVAVVGRPNAGKSTLINRMVGEERLLTGPEAGITRDSISVEWQWRDRRFELFDTAGLRRKARVQAKLEKLSVADALRAVRFAEVVIVLLDATAPFEKQDLQIADLVIREGRAPVIALNKWDLIEGRQAALAGMLEQAERLLPQIKGLQVVPVSAATGYGVDALLESVLEVHAAWNRRIATARLNRWLEQVLAHHPPPAVAGRRIRIKYVTQVKARPPTFMVSCPRPAALPESYRRYLVNDLRETFGLWSTPIRMHFRAARNPYAEAPRRRR